MGHLIERLIATSIRHRVFVIAATLIAAIAGGWAFATITTDAFPDLTPNQVIVMTTAGGLSPVEVEQQITYPMEVAMLGLPRSQGVRSISKTGLSVVTVTFDDDVDLYFARGQVQQRMQDAKMQLPPGQSRCSDHRRPRWARCSSTWSNEIRRRPHARTPPRSSISQRCKSTRSSRSCEQFLASPRSTRGAGCRSSFSSAPIRRSSRATDSR